MKDIWKQFHLFKKENQLKHFLVHTPSIDPNDILVVQYEIRAPGVLQAGIYSIETLSTSFLLSKLQLEFAKIQAPDLAAVMSALCSS